ncbi:MAG: peptidylprolyl isomerase [Candidatus Brocadiaceae bacterium]
MAQAKHGDIVKVHYTGKLDDGTIFDSSQDREPLEFTIGGGEIIPGFEHAVIGMKSGELKTIKILADEAYGQYREEMIMVVDRNGFPNDLKLGLGLQLQMRHESGQIVPVTVIDISDSDVTLDANHPLAGENLTFDITLV